jgi:hypothetical protein
MDTYGHLFPGSEADAIDKMPDLLAEKSAVHAQYSPRGSGRFAAAPCGTKTAV